MKLLNHLRLRQSGMTLIELLIAMGISTLIISSVSGVIYQIIMNNARHTAHMVAIKQVENALHFLVRDIQMAQTIQTDSLPGDDVLQLTWTDWDNTNYVITYSLTDTVLSREYQSEGNASISRYIANLDVNYADNEVIVDISASVNNSTFSENREIKILPRNSY